MSDGERGFLIPPWYHTEEPSDSDFHIASIVWGFTLAYGTFTFSKAVQQSWKSYKNGNPTNAYVMMVWAEWASCMAMSVLSWLFLSPEHIIKPS
jgi:hypothetical protein